MSNKAYMLQIRGLVAEEGKEAEFKAYLNKFQEIIEEAKASKDSDTLAVAVLALTYIGLELSED